MITISNRQRFLQEELNEYENHTPMNAEERKALHEWVAEGHSVHENTSMAEDGHGNSVDFIDVYREEQEIRDTLSTVTSEEQEEYLAELRGEVTLKSLQKQFDELWYKASVYVYVLRKHGLMKEAEDMIEEGKARSKAFDEAITEGGFEW